MAQPAAILNILVNANAAGAIGSLRAVEGQLLSTGKRAGKFGGQMQAASKAALAATAGVAAGALKLSIDFDRSMRNVNSIAQLPEKQFKALEKSVLSLAGKTAQAPKTLADGLYDLVSSGFQGKDAMTVLEASAKAATAGLTDTATSTRIVAAVLNAYHRPAADAAKVSDTLFQTVNLGVISFEQLANSLGDVLPFASQVGISVDQLGASISTMTKAGIGPEETMTRLKNVIVALIKPNDDLQTAIEKTGVASGEALIKQKGLQGALDAIIGTTDGSKQAVAKLFPNIRALGAALALTGQNSKSANEDLKSFKDTSGATATALKEQAKSISYQWNRIKASLEAVTIRIGSKVLPAIAKVFDWMSKHKDVVISIAAGFGALAVALSAVALAAALSNPFTAAAVAVAALAAAVVYAWQNSDTFREKVTAAWKTIKDVVPPAARAVKDAVVTAFNAVVGAFQSSVQFVQNLMNTVVNEVKQWDVAAAIVKTSVGIIWTVVSSTFPVIVSIVKTAWGVVQAIFKGAWTAIVGIVKGGLQVLRGIIEIIGGIFKGDFGQMWDGVKRIFSGSVTAIVGILKGSVQTIAGAALAIGKGVVDFIAKGLVGIGKLFSGLGGKIINAAGGILKDVGQFFWNLGKGIVQAIVNAIKSAPGAIVDAVKSIIPGPVKKALGAVGGAAGSAWSWATGAAGGFVSGGQRGKDSVPALLAPGEAVLTGPGQKMLDAMAGPGATRFLMANQPAHFAKGGMVGGTSGKVFDFFRGKGFTPAQAAAWVGNLMQESNLNPGAVNPSSKAYGIAQWLGGRLTGLKKTSGWQSLGGQLAYIWKELQGSESTAYKKIKGSKTLEDAVNAITWAFERPGKGEANVAHRIAVARAALKAGGKGTGASATTSKGVSQFDMAMATAQLAMSEAARTSGTGDDAVALKQQQQVIGKQIQRIRKALKGKLSPAARLHLTQSLSSLLDQHTHLGQQRADLASGGSSADLGVDSTDTAAQDMIAAQDAATQAMKDLQASIDAQTNFARQVAGTQSASLAKSITALVSVQIAGLGVAGRALLPGAGKIARY